MKSRILSLFFVLVLSSSAFADGSKPGDKQSDENEKYEKGAKVDGGDVVVTIGRGIKDGAIAIKDGTVDFVKGVGRAGRAVGRGLEYVARHGDLNLRVGTNNNRFDDAGTITRSQDVTINLRGGLYRWCVNMQKSDEYKKYKAKGDRNDGVYDEVTRDHESVWSDWDYDYRKKSPGVKRFWGNDLENCKLIRKAGLSNDREVILLPFEFAVRTNVRGDYGRDVDLQKVKVSLYRYMNEYGFNYDLFSFVYQNQAEVLDASVIGFEVVDLTEKLDIKLDPNGYVELMLRGNVYFGFTTVKTGRQISQDAKDWLGDYNSQLVAADPEASKYSRDIVVGGGYNYGGGLRLNPGWIGMQSILLEGFAGSEGHGYGDPGSLKLSRDTKGVGVQLKLHENWNLRGQVRKDKYNMSYNFNGVNEEGFTVSAPESQNDRVDARVINFTLEGQF